MSICESVCNDLSGLTFVNYFIDNSQFVEEGIQLAKIILSLHPWSTKSTTNQIFTLE